MESDPTKKELIKTNFKIKAESLVGSLFTAEQAHSFVNSFETNALRVQERQINEAKGIVRQNISVDPIRTHNDILIGRYNHILKTEDAKADMLELAKSASKIKLDEDKKKLDEQKKTNHDNDEKEIGNLFMKGEYSKAYTIALGSNNLGGDEKKTWANAIDIASKAEKEKIDPNIETAEIVMINDLIAKNVDPRVIRNSVIITPRLSGANKEQYLAKLETKLTTEIADGKRQGYADIKDIIFPPARGLSIEGLIQTPQQTTAIMKAQMTLDEWIDRQIKLEKYPTRNEIRNKAFELANSYNPSITSRIEFLEEKAKKQAEEIKKAKEKKK
jgi:hypothetical protein